MKKVVRGAFTLSFLFLVHIYPDVSSQVHNPTSSQIAPSEALILRRITEYWKDKDFSSVKVQIIHFLEKNPSSSLKDHLNALLGDLHFQEKEFAKALTAYNSLSDSKLEKKVFINKLQAQFEMRKFLKVIKVAESFVKGSDPSPLQEKVRYLLAESMFRHALSCSEYDQQAFYLKRAKPHYKILTQTTYGQRALFPLAEVHRLLKENERAAVLYLKLAQKYSKYKERFLFQAAILQTKTDKEAAIETFSKVHAMGQRRCALAAFNQLVLLYQTKNYEGFLENFGQMIKDLPEEKTPLLHFYKGRCHYFLGDYDLATLPLETFLQGADRQKKEQKTAHLLLINCSRYLQDFALMEKSINAFCAQFPKDPQAPSALLMYAQMCRDEGEFEKALDQLQILTSSYPNYAKQEHVLYDLALLFAQTDQFAKAKETFGTFLDHYPTSKKAKSAWRHLLNCAIEQIQTSPSDPSHTSKESFIQTLSSALAKEGLLNEQEKEQYTLTLFKCKCELGYYQATIEPLSHFLQTATQPQHLAHGHLLMAICQEKAHHDLDAFIEHAQIALSFKEPLPQVHLLHLELYNAYLSQSQNTHNAQQAKHLEIQAADHLYYSKAWKERAIKMDNHLWLANHYYERAQDDCQVAQKRAEKILNDLLCVEGNLNISSDNLFLEAQTLKLAHLFHIKGDLACEKELLSSLIQKQEQNPQLGWRLKNRAIFELGKTYEASQNFEQALTTYQALAEEESLGSFSIVKNSAKLHLAKLQYKVLPREKQVSDHPELISILHTLKDLQIQKKLLCEPLHLEASLSYAEIRTSLSKEVNSSFFYQRMFDDFHSQIDPITEEYTNLREQYPQKDALFGAYMNYLSALILHCDASNAKVAQKGDKALELDSSALNLLSSLMEQKNSMGPYLYERVKKVRGQIASQL